MLHKVDHLAIELDLENAWIHKQLHGIRVEQVLAIAQLATKILNLGALHRCLSELKYGLGQVNRSRLLGYDRNKAAREEFLQ